MKRFLAVVLAALVLMVDSALAEADWYLKTGVELAAKVGDLARDDVYQQEMTGADFDCISPLKDADFTTLDSAWMCRMPDQAVLEALLPPELKLSDAGMEREMAVLPSVFVSMYNGKQGMEQAAAASILTFFRTYEMPEGFEPCLVVLELDGAMVGVAFARTGETTVTAQAAPLFCEAGAAVKQVLADMIVEELPVKFVQIA